MELVLTTKSVALDAAHQGWDSAANHSPSAFANEWTASTRASEELGWSPGTGERGLHEVARMLMPALSPKEVEQIPHNDLVSLSTQPA